MAEILVQNVVKRYDQYVLGPCSFTVKSGSTLFIMGPSGSGKSTLIKACAGLIDVEGKVTIRDAKRVCVVFDEPKCLNHLSVQENITLGMLKEGYSTSEIEQRVQEVAQQMELSDYLKKTPDELSFGQRQRVAIARALVRDFDVLLMDEPFSGLDILLRKRMLELIQKKQKETGFTCMIVTHDHRDARILSDQMMILNQGKIEMIGSYEECVHHPVNAFVEAFLA